jgi:protein TonB
MVDVLPSFPGGSKQISNYLSKNVKYPAKDRENNLQGKVIAQFIVEPDGRLTDVKALRSPSKAMADEAVRVLSNSPKWKPGKVNGKAVRSQYHIPVNFVLSDEG